MYLSFFFPSVSKHSSILHEYAVEKDFQQVMKLKIDYQLENGSISFLFRSSTSNLSIRGRIRICKGFFLGLIAVSRFANKIKHFESTKAYLLYVAMNMHRFPPGIKKLVLFTRNDITETTIDWKRRNKPLGKRIGEMNYPFAGVFLDVNGKNVGFHESEKVLDAHFCCLIFCSAFRFLSDISYFISLLLPRESQRESKK